MAFEEQIRSYKVLPFKQRTVILLLLGVIYPAYHYYEKSESLSASLVQAEEARSEAEQKLAEARQKKADLPKKMQELANAKEELVKSTEAVNMDFKMDEILRNVANFAKDTSVTVEEFTPDELKVVGSRIQYAEQNIDLKLRGKYTQATRFLDSLLNVGPITFIDDLRYQRYMVPQANTVGNQIVNDDRTLVERSLVKVSAKVRIVKKADNS